MEHPRLGPLTLAEGYENAEPGEFRAWQAAASLPIFAARGVALRNDEDPPPGMVWVRVEDPYDTGISPQQEAAIAHLLEHEPEVFAAVWGELAPVLKNFNLETEVICTEVVVSSLHVQGIAYMGFSIECDGHLEHGFQVVYHPAGDTRWGDWDALCAIEEVDNLPRPPE